jgi:hypothetical protein
MAPGGVTVIRRHLVIGAILAGSFAGCGNQNKPVPTRGLGGNTVAASNVSASKLEPQMQGLIDAIRNGSDRDRAKAVAELRKAGPTAAQSAAALCELTTYPERRIDALLALETVSPGFFSPVRILITADDLAAETKAADAPGELAAAGRPAVVVLRWHLEKSSKAHDVERMGSDLAALAKISPGDPELLKALTALLTFNADNKDGRNSSEQLHKTAIRLLALVADSQSNFRAEIADAFLPLLDDKMLKLTAIQALPFCAQEVRGVNPS